MTHKMLHSDYEASVVDAVMNYYNHNYEVFFEYLDEAVVWYGPKEDMYVVGKTNLQKMLSEVNKDVKFKVENIKTKLFVFSASIYCVIMTYKLNVFYTDGNTKRYTRRVTFNGRRCKDNDGNVFWRCPYLEVSNISSSNGHQNVNSSKDFEGKASERKPKQVAFVSDESDNDSKKRLFFAGDNHSTICVKQSTIKYIEGGKGVCSNIYVTTGEVFHVHHLLKDIVKMLPESFYRCHSSYIVNTSMIASISSSKIVLVDGTEVPIPVKRATEIINDLKKLLNKT